MPFTICRGVPTIRQQRKEAAIEVVKARFPAIFSVVLLLGFGLWWAYSATPVPPATNATQPAPSKFEELSPELPSVDHPVSASVESTDPRPVIQLLGRVLDVRGGSLAGVNVSYSGVGGRAVTDDQGFYQASIFANFNRTRYDLTFQINGYSKHHMQVKLRDQSISELVLDDVILEPLGTAIGFGGVIRNDNGMAIAGETVNLYSPTLDTRHKAQSDDNGVFRFSDVYAATDYRLWINSQEPYSGYSKSMFEVADEPTYLEITLETSVTRHLQGRMVDLQGRGIPHRSLLLESDKAPSRALSVTGDADGYFRTENVPAGRLTLRSGTAPYLAVDGIESIANEGELVDIVLDLGGGMVEGRVMSSSGVPVAGAEVRMDWLQSYEGYRSRSRRFRSSDENGAFSFDNLGRGHRQISVKASGFLDAEVGLDEHSQWVEVYLQDP